jgi:hypothetical protein
MDQVIVAQVMAAPAGVTQVPNRSGRGSRYIVKTSDGNEWVTFDPTLGMKAGGFQGQLATLTVAIENSPDGRYTNYNLKDIGPAMAGAQPTQVAGVPQQQATVAGGQPTAEQLAAAGVTQAGSRSRYSDEELWEFARKDGAAVAGAIFSGKGEDLDLQKFWALAEGVSKFVRLRQHQGWDPKTEIGPDGPRPVTGADVVATVNAEAGANVVQEGVPEQQVDAASAATAAAAGAKKAEWD